MKNRSLTFVAVLLFFISIFLFVYAALPAEMTNPYTDAVIDLFWDYPNSTSPWADEEHMPAEPLPSPGGDLVEEPPVPTSTVTNDPALLTLPTPDKSQYIERSYLEVDVAELYDMISDEIASGALRIEHIRAKQFQDVLTAFICVFYDHPEYFWLNGASQSEYYEYPNYVDVTITFEPTFDMAELDWRRENVENIIKPIVNYVKDLPDYQKVKFVYEWVIGHTDYDLNYVEDQTFYSTIVDRKGVCTGYARTMQYILQLAGISCGLATGSTPTDPHAWVIAQVNGQYCHIDPTWGDPVTADGHSDISYEYFCVSDETIFSTHTLDSDAPYYPQCPTDENSYYIRERRYLDNFNLDAVKSWITFDLEASGACEFRCMDEDSYRHALAYISDGDVTQEIGGYSYRSSDPSRTIFVFDK